MNQKVQERWVAFQKYTTQNSDASETEERLNKNHMHMQRTSRGDKSPLPKSWLAKQEIHLKEQPNF